MMMMMMMMIKKCKRLKFDHITKWYMLKPVSIQENETNKNLRGFEIYTECFPPRRVDFVLINKKKRDCQVDFAVPVDHKIK